MQFNSCRHQGLSQSVFAHSVPAVELATHLRALGSINSNSLRTDCSPSEDAANRRQFLQTQKRKVTRSWACQDPRSNPTPSSLSSCVLGWPETYEIFIPHHSKLRSGLFKSFLYQRERNKWWPTGQGCPSLPSVASLCLCLVSYTGQGQSKGVLGLKALFERPYLQPPKPSLPFSFPG